MGDREMSFKEIHEIFMVGYRMGLDDAKILQQEGCTGSSPEMFVLGVILGGVIGWFFSK